jgi:uncharacterized protein (TIGR03435 family)
MRTLTPALAISLLCSSIPSARLLSQTNSQKLSFEVASIKEHPFAPGFMGLDVQPGGRFVAMMLPLQMLITVAYDILPAQLEFAPNVPDAPLKTMYDIEAKAEANAIPPGRLSQDNEHKMRLMLQSLVADRFKLKMHTEKRELPIYALLVDKSGLKLQKAPDRDCSARPSPCRWTSQTGPAHGINGDSMTLDDLSEALTPFADRNIVNKTGIEDRFDIHLPPYSRGAAIPGTLVDGVPVDVHAPSIATILHEVGLQLEPQKELMDVYIVDHVEKPTPN